MKMEEIFSIIFLNSFFYDWVEGVRIQCLCHAIAPIAFRGETPMRGPGRGGTPTRGNRFYGNSIE